VNQEDSKSYFFSNIEAEIMCDLLIACGVHGHKVSGSITKPDTYFTSKLKNHKFLPNTVGWRPNLINSSLEAVITYNNGHNKNPEVEKAKEINIPVYTISEFLFQQAINKQRILIVGNNSRLITAILIHTLEFYKREFDYYTHSINPNLDSLVRLSNAPTIIIEDENINESDIMAYKHHIAVIGQLENSKLQGQIAKLVKETPKGGIIFYLEKDSIESWIKQADFPDRLLVPYKIHQALLDGSKGGNTIITNNQDHLHLTLNDAFALHSLGASKEILMKIGISANMFYNSLSSFNYVNN